jgi:nucleoside-diphosphate-sugar epimerase
VGSNLDTMTGAVDRSAASIGGGAVTDKGLHVVLGASGGTGNAVARALLERGRTVRGVNRAGDAELPAGIERVAADVTRTDDLRRALDGADVVYHCAQPPYTDWAEGFPPMNRAIVDATAEVGAKLVFADNLYLYGPVGAPLTEDSPQEPRTRKGIVRKLLADDLLAAHREARLRVTIGRSSDYIGPRAPDSAIGERVFEAALNGKHVPWIGGLDVPHTVAYTPDMGRALAILGERPEADGAAWHLPCDDPATGRGFVELLSAALGRPLRPKTTSATMITVAGLFSPMIREIGDVIEQWTQPFVADWSRFREAFGPFEVTPLADAVASTLDWYRQR